MAPVIDRADHRAAEQLAQTLAPFRLDPLGYVMSAFPWGQPARPWPAKTAPNPGSARSWRSSARASCRQMKR